MVSDLLEQEINDLKQRISGLEAVVFESHDVPEEADQSHVVNEVIAFTKEIFSGEAQVFEEEDPEILGRHYYLYQVTAKGSVDEIAELDDRRHRRLCQIANRIPGRHTLSIILEESN